MGRTSFFLDSSHVVPHSTGGCAAAVTNLEKHTQTILSVTRWSFVQSKSNQLDEPCDLRQLVQHSSLCVPPVAVIQAFQN